MNLNIYADQVSKISVSGNMVRIDFTCLDPLSHDDSGQLVFTLSNRLVMPLKGFMHAFVLQQDIVNKLIQSGVLTAMPAGSAEPENLVVHEENNKAGTL